MGYDRGEKIFSFFTVHVSGNDATLWPFPDTNPKKEIEMSVHPDMMRELGKAIYKTPAVISPALCRLWKRATEARIIAGNAAARATSAAISAAAIADEAAALPDYSPDADEAAEIAARAEREAAEAAERAAMAEGEAERAALAGDHKSARLAVKSAIRAERAALAA